MKTSFVILLLLFSGSCDDKNNLISQNKKSEVYKTVYSNDSIIKIKWEYNFQGKNFKLIKVVSKKKPDINNSDIREFPIISQEFYLNNKKLNLPIYKKRILLNNGNYLLVEDIQLQDFSIARLNNEYIFEISGIGGCQFCNEYILIENFKGEKISEHYHNKDTIYIDFKTKNTKNAIKQLNKHSLESLSLIKNR